MEKTDVSNLETINIVMVGHIDHGKTTLLQKLSGKWTDTHSEELKRGITIKLGYADSILYKDEKEGYNISKKGKTLRYVSFIDAPGHEMLMATMLSGTAIVDAAILVIAANEGIKPQTREHLTALQAKGIKNIIIVQNKIDLVTKEQALKNYKEIKKFVEGTVAEEAPIIPVSAQQNINIQKIYESIASIKIPERNKSDKPIFIIARSFDINRPGTRPSELYGAVLGGALKQGTLKVGDEIEIKPGQAVKEANQLKYKTLRTKIKRLHKGDYELEEITPGGSLAIETELDMALGKKDILSGCVASKVGDLEEITTNIRVKFKLFNELPGISQATPISQIKPSETLMLSVNTATTVGMVKRTEEDEMELNLKIPIVPFKKENVGIARNINNHWRLIGHGEII